MRSYIFLFIFIFLACSCSVSKQIDKVAKQNILNNPELSSAHIGISIYDPSINKYLYNHNGDKYFIPASNTKIITCYAAMKYLGDSLIGIRYKIDGDTLTLIPSGDPTLLHPDFGLQPVYNFLKNNSCKNIQITQNNWDEKALGAGWSWDDYNDYYMVERSAMPLYGNIVRIDSLGSRNETITPKYFRIDYNVYGNGRLCEVDNFGNEHYSIVRNKDKNQFNLQPSTEKINHFEIPFVTGFTESAALLKDTIYKNFYNCFCPTLLNKNEYSIIHSQPTDSLLKIMMHRSDNFFAEQSLLMVSNEMLGIMNDEKIIDTLLKIDFKKMPQQPRWVDGSGLSRYNLFTPQTFVFVLNKLRNEFNWDRITTIFPTGGTGTLGGAYQDLEGKIYAKSGTLSNNAALSGYIITNKGKLMIFSILIGNHMSGSATIRNAIVQFLNAVIRHY